MEGDHAANAPPADMPVPSNSQWTIDGARKTRRTSKSVIGADFVRAKEEELADTMLGRLRTQAAKFISSMYLAHFMVTIVFLDAYCTCRDIDARAQLSETPEVFRTLSDLCLVLYTLELIFQLVLNGAGIVKDWMIMMDIFIIVCGYLELILDFGGATSSLEGISVIRALRLVRIFRLIRLLRKIRTLRELHKLATMMATCAKTLVWSFLLCFLVMTLWSMLMVEVVHPLIRDLGNSGNGFGTCRRCERAMGSVMDANLLLFTTVIAGDSWGEIAVPVIEQYPATAFIFMGSLLTLVFGVLNLIVAVVVDTFADARLNDVQNLAEEMEDDIAADRRSLAKLFQRIDADGSGQLTLEELIEGAQRDSDFQSRLRVMDIDESDLQLLFEMIDADQSGTIEAAEFIGPLSRWAHDSKTAPRFIKYNMLQTMRMQEDLWEMSTDCFKHLALQIDKVHVEVKALKKKKRKGRTSESLEVPADIPMEESADVPERVEFFSEFGQQVEQVEAHNDGAIRVTLSECNEDREARTSFSVSPSPGPTSGRSSRVGSATISQTSFEPNASVHECPAIPETDILEEMEHMLSMRPSRQTEMLSEKSRESRADPHLDLLLESAVAKLEASMKKMERLARAADIMVRKWHEAPDAGRRRGASTSTSSRKSDVFWALYMDRDHVRERRAKKRHTSGPSGRRSGLSSDAPRARSEREQREHEKSYYEDDNGAGVSGTSGISLSFASSIMDDLEEEPQPLAK